MKATKRIAKALRALAKALDEEAGNNPEFDEKIEAVFEGLLGNRSPRETTSSENPKRNTVTDELPDVFKELERLGSDEFAFSLRAYDPPLLKAIVSANGFDPERKSARWTEPDKFVALIREQMEARLRRGAAFLEKPQPETKKDTPRPKN